ncbi:MAG: phosphatase PAP2 family protein [Chlorobiaceae bacterium]|nr:phosphatase PAP2 family protein [Chlorobiaceae bacterium]NTV17391.1 phosphatase PAP2 family protein [Chlorobiaceae bacterium]
MALIEQADVWLFRLLNLNLVYPAADDLMVFLTDGLLSWYVFLLAALFISIRKGKNGFLLILLALLSIGLADFTASGILKPFVQRVRPCFALDHVRLLVSQPRSYSFASSHAANSAAFAAITWIFFHRGKLVEKLFTGVMILFALAVSYSRVYVGVHYPGDVLAGMVVGVCSAILVYLLFSWILKNVIQPRQMRKESCGYG